MDFIHVRGARQNNLRNIDVDIPHRAITVITGPSGSGKSSLAFDTIYAEGQRRYVESLSAYARQFLERMPKPDVDRMDGLAPAVAIQQKNPTRTARSTVGTATEVYDYLRLLWARIGRAICPLCGRELRPDSPGSAADTVLSLPGGTRFMVAFALPRSDLSTHELILDDLRERGFVRVIADGRALHLDDVVGDQIDLRSPSELLVVVDRLEVDADNRGRLVDAFATAFREGYGDAAVLFSEPIVHPALQGAPGARINFTEKFQCPDDGTQLPVPTPQLFSFNSPRGACETCSGFGAVLEYDLRLIVPDAQRTLRDGAIDPWTMPRYDNKRRALAEFAKNELIPLDRPWSALSAAQQERILHARVRGYVGIFPFLEGLEKKRYKQYIRVFLRRYQMAHPCPACGGTRLRPDALHIRINGRDIASVSALSLDALRTWIGSLELEPMERAIADHILREARDRVGFLNDVGLSYLSLDRATRTLSGGEAQRISLSNALGSRLVDTLYVLDEPTIGLHARDVGRLLDLLTRLRDAGNTVLMVEHDLAAIRASDHMLELGPHSGERGGQLVFAGPVQQAEQSPLTGQYLTGAREIPLPDKRRRPTRWLTLSGARANTLRGVDVRIPLGALTCVTGVSGSGKSTLVHDVLYRALARTLTGEHGAREHLGEIVGEYDRLDGANALSAVALIDQEPIGRTPRSNPITYIKAYDRIRELFAAQPLSRQRGYTASTFSFNVPGGRCETCEGAGYVQVEMQFLADVFVPCDVCGGDRFKAEVLEVRVRDRNIMQVLSLTVDEAIRFFPHEDKLGQALWYVQQVGLGYLRLGQPATTLSGGEAQRVKIARELAQTSRHAGKRLYILDEPTTGLHIDDVRQLVSVFNRLVDHGHTLVVIEHNLDVIKLADWIIDMGPEGGEAGGRIVAMGPPEEIADVAESHTGTCLRSVLVGVA
jgi:excinuclease ABC subunit A